LYCIVSVHLSISTFNRLLIFSQEKDLEVSNAQYAVAAAAAELAEPCDSLNSSLNKNQLDDMLGLRRTVSTLEHEVLTLKEQNASLQEELNRAVSMV